MKDAYDFFEEYDREQNSKIQELPVCCYCDEPIQDESAYCINGDWYCESCLENHFKKYVEDCIA